MRTDNQPHAGYGERDILQAITRIARATDPGDRLIGLDLDVPANQRSDAVYTVQQDWMDRIRQLEEAGRISHSLAEKARQSLEDAVSLVEENPGFWTRGAAPDRVANDLDTGTNIDPATTAAITLDEIRRRAASDSHFERLGIDRSATRDEIERAENGTRRVLTAALGEGSLAQTEYDTLVRTFSESKLSLSIAASRLELERDKMVNPTRREVERLLGDGRTAAEIEADKRRVAEELKKGTNRLFDQPIADHFRTMPIVGPVFRFFLGDASRVRHAPEKSVDFIMETLARGRDLTELTAIHRTTPYGWTEDIPYRNVLNMFDAMADLKRRELTRQMFDLSSPISEQEAIREFDRFQRQEIPRKVRDFQPLSIDTGYSAHFVEKPFIFIMNIAAVAAGVFGYGAANGIFHNLTGSFAKLQEYSLGVGGMNGPALICGLVGAFAVSAFTVWRVGWKAKNDVYDQLLEARQNSISPHLRLLFIKNALENASKRAGLPESYLDSVYHNIVESVAIYRRQKPAEEQMPTAGVPDAMTGRRIGLDQEFDALMAQMPPFYDTLSLLTKGSQNRLGHELVSLFGALKYAALSVHDYEAQGWVEKGTNMASLNQSLREIDPSISQRLLYRQRPLLMIGRDALVVAALGAVFWTCAANPVIFNTNFFSPPTPGGDKAGAETLQKIFGK